MVNFNPKLASVGGLRKMSYGPAKLISAESSLGSAEAAKPDGAPSLILTNDGLLAKNDQKRSFFVKVEKKLASDSVIPDTLS